MLGSPIPAACPRCGSANTARVEWGFTAAGHGVWRAGVDGVAVIVGGQDRPPGAPDWVCLSCQPGWSAVHQAALHEEECQQGMEDVVSAADFVAAVEWRDRKRAARERLRELIAPLLAGGGPPG